MKRSAALPDTTLDPVDCILAARFAVKGNAVMTFDNALKKKIVTGAVDFRHEEFERVAGD